VHSLDRLPSGALEAAGKEESTALEDEEGGRQKRYIVAVGSLNKILVGSLMAYKDHPYRIHHRCGMDDMRVYKRCNEKAMRAGRGKHFTYQVTGKSGFHFPVEQVLSAKHFRIKNVSYLSQCHSLYP
jgi:hypothetical protein